MESHVLILQIDHRNHSDSDYHDLCLRMRNGKPTEGDRIFLNKRDPSLHPNFFKKHKDVVHLFADNKLCDTHNEECVILTGNPSCWIQARHSNPAAARLGSKGFRGLRNRLLISVGAKIMSIKIFHLTII